MELVYRPISLWPGKLTTARKRSPFKAGWSDTLQLLDTELRHLGARSVVLQVALTEDDIRLDGRPRAGAAMQHPGVILAFDSKYGPLSYPCDTYGEWRADVRAIALSLAALRAVDRYGVTRRAEQYKGWQQLPDRSAPASMSRDEALRVLVQLSEVGSVGPSDRAGQVAAYRQAAMRHHPDRGGDAEQFKRLQVAKEVLDL